MSRLLGLGGSVVPIPTSVGKAPNTNADFSAWNLLNLATLLSGLNVSKKPASPNPELDVSLRIIPETFEVTLLPELRLSF